jgi:hypothetical protein
MKLPITIACLFACLSAAAQSPLGRDAITVAAVTNRPTGQSQAWAYIFWQTDAADLVKARSYSIWQKTGSASSANSYARIGIVKLQSDPVAVGAIIERAQLALGEDLPQLDDLVTELFESLMPSLSNVPAEQRLATKVAAVLRGVAADPAKAKSLVLAARYHPAIAMAAGQAFSAKIPASGAVTFELREYDPVTQADAAVLGRVTVDHSQPLVMPPPSVVFQIPDLAQAGFNHLNVKLVWDTPNELRRLQPLAQGANVYRVKRSKAEASSWNTTPPAAATLAAQSLVADSDVRQVNHSPIMPMRLLDGPQTLQSHTGDQFLVDDATKMPGYPALAARPKNGDQYYYFVTSTDILGRPNAGASSPGLLVTFCDRLQPDVPAGLKVTNDYTYNNGAPKQLLRLTWKANDNSGDKKTHAYLVYRWATSDGPMQPNMVTGMPEGANVESHRIGTAIAHVAGQATFTYLDEGPGSPSVTTDLNQTFWYTVRAVDDADISRPVGGVVVPASIYGGNLSPHSPAAYGTLRDRTGPDAPNGGVRILCADPEIAANGVARSSDATLDPTQRYIQLIATRPAFESNIEAVDFEQQVGATWTPLGRVHFTTGANTLTRHLTFLPGALGSPINFRARTVTGVGETSTFVTQTLTEPPTLGIALATWDTSVTYTRVAPSARCHTHTPPPPGTGVVPPGGNNVTVQFLPSIDTKEYKLYYRIDASPLTLAKEDAKNFTPGVVQTIEVQLLPAVTSELCLFLQVFDKDGNPSPMQLIECILVKGSTSIAKPMLAPIGSSGTVTTPVADLQWFCPPPGVDHFEVWIRSTQGTLPASLGVSLNQSITDPTGTSVEEGLNYTYQIYNSEHVGPLFGNGSTFALSAGVSSGQTLRVKVRAVTETGEAGPFSNVETYHWKTPPTFTGPDVPWPARPLPLVGGGLVFSSPIAPYYLAPGFVGISIGSFAGAAVAKNGVMQIPTTGQPESLLFTAMFSNPDGPRNMLPCVLYRTQIPDQALPIPNYPTVPGDVVQVSPLMENIAFAVEPKPVGPGTGLTIYDPFIHIVTGTTGVFTSIYLKDTTPVISGARYQYLLVLLDPSSHEIAHVLPLPTIDIP